MSPLLRTDYFWLVDEIAGKLGISSDSAGLAKKLLRDAREKRITGGRRPVTLAASALYVACRLRGEWMTQRELAVAVDCSEIAIRHAYLLLKDRLGLDFSSKCPSNPCDEPRRRLKRLAAAKVRLGKVLWLISDCSVRLKELEAERDSLLECIRGLELEAEKA